MANHRVDFDVVRKLALALPDVAESTIHGAPSLKVRGKLLACPAIHRSVEPDTLAVRIDFETRTEFLAAKPKVYYVTDHYLGHPMVLVRLKMIDRRTLRGLLSKAWRFVHPNPNARPAKPPEPTLPR